MGFRFYTLTFGVAVLILTAVGLAFFYYESLVLTPLSIWFYLVAVVLVFGFAADYFILDNKLGWKKFLLLSFGLIIISATITQTFATIVTPRWSFSVYTDKSTYKLGENVTITVCLKNTGFITHSFASVTGNTGRECIDVGVRPQEAYSPVWGSLVYLENANCTIRPNQILQRTFIWNQTANIGIYKERGWQAEPGQYRIYGQIRDAHWNLIFSDYPGTLINITST